MCDHFSAGLLATTVLVAGYSVAMQPAPQDSVVGRHVFVPNTERWVGVERDKWLLIGKLDSNGDFVHEIKLEKGQPRSAGIPPYRLLNGGPTPKKVYEFRSGVLVPGELRKDGNFVPEVGGKIIAFADYTYISKATPIWNLPGGFEPEKPSAPKK